MSRQSFEQLIDSIYEVPLSADGWMSLAPALQEHLGAPVALFLAGPADVRLLGDAGPVSGPEMHDYADHLWREDRAMAALQSAPPGQVIADSQLVSDRERRTSRFYNDLLGANGLERGLYASVARGKDGLMFIAAQRSAFAGDYDLAEVGAIRRIVPHLRRSYRTWLRIREAELQRGTALDAMEHVTLGIALVDEAGKLHFANRVAEHEMSKGALTVAHGRVTCRSSHAAHALRAAVRAAARQKRAIAQRVIVGDGEGPSPLSVLVAPVRDQATAGLHPSNLAMLLIGRRELNAVEEVALGTAYGLTPAEARLLAALVDGERLPTYARRHGIAVTTAKTHLKALFDKVGERRQADLIRRAVSDPFLRSGSTSPSS